MRRRKVLIGIMALSALLIGIRYVTLNAQYPNPVEHVVEMNEKLDLGNYTFQLKDWQQGDGSIINDILPGYDLLADSNGESYPKEMQKMALATVEISKNAEDGTYLDLTTVAFEMGAWSNQWDHMLFEALNGERSLMLELEKGDKVDIVFPIVMYEFQFSNDEWKQIKNNNIKIVLSCYPKKEVLLGRGCG